MDLDKHSSERLTLKETALLAGVTEKLIRHELADKVVVPRHVEGRRLYFWAADVFYLRLISELRFALTKSDRKHLFILLADNKDAQGPWRLQADRLTLTGRVPTDIWTTKLERELTQRLKLFLRGKRRVVSRPDILGGEPVFEGTRISVRHVGQLVKKGVPEAELLQDFPALDKRDLEFARMYTALGRPPGRPKKLRFIRDDR
ncbi:DUF433 domain-containing protein [Archangium sp.]|uniref:DUF433 domain-containing protein n=1 Tax=Archangium sp. TaxID=1872627 RepID=UPI00286BDE5D|nr:DUF433 domain-containing protein [Archangium sp.]